MTLDLPPEAEAIRTEIRAEAARIGAFADKPERRQALVDAGLLVPHWPKPWGRDAGAVEQIVIDEEMRAAGVKVPGLGITGWNIMTVNQYATPDQVERWVLKTLMGEYVWCQLFSEPDAGSDAAAVKTRGTRVDGGWTVNGQKVWTSGAQYCHLGLATVRTDPDAPKHSGITTMVIDMHAPGVEVRPLRQITGNADFNEVFFNDVFVPDDDVVGAVNDGWTVARSTLGQRARVDRRRNGWHLPSDGPPGPAQARGRPRPRRIGPHRGHPGQGARAQGAEPAPRPACRRRRRDPVPRATSRSWCWPSTATTGRASRPTWSGRRRRFLDGEDALAGYTQLATRAMSIAGGTSEITRNQIAERILGLPRDPLNR